MNRTALAAVVFLGLAGAAPPAPSVPYLPSDGWSLDDGAEFYERWFGGQLRAMGEPVLSAAADSKTGFRRRFRMLVLPTFHHAYAIRVDEPVAGQATVRAVRLSGRGGYSPGTILEEERHVLGRAAIRRLHRALAEVNLARLSREEAPPEAENGVITVCADGVRFVFELVDERGSHLVTRGCELDRGLWVLIDAADALRKSVGSDLRRYR